MGNPKLMTLGVHPFIKTIALDNIAFAESSPTGIGTRIVLKQMKDGNNEEILVVEPISTVNHYINSLLKELKAEQ